MSYDEGLAERIRRLVGGEAEISERKMFGGIAFMAGPNMFVGVVKDDLLARVGPERHEEAIARPGARIMDFSGRPMKGFLYVSPEGVGSDAELKRWVDECLMFARSLPAKKPASSRPKRRAGLRPYTAPE